MLTWRSQAVLSFGPSAPIQPPRRCACGFLIFHGRRGGRKRYCPSDLPLRSIPPRLAARCPPLTAAGGQGPPDDTAYDRAHIHYYRLLPGGPEHPHTVLAIHIQSGPSTDISYLPSPCTALVCPIHLSSGMGLSTIVHFRTISYRRDALFQIAHTL